LSEEDDDCCIQDLLEGLEEIDEDFGEGPD
jgi:hypothetical protein